jgi:chromosome segregation ATPase
MTDDPGMGHVSPGLDDAERQRARAEGVAAEIREELERTRDELAALGESVPARIDAARTEVTENLAIRHQLELDAVTAGYQGQIGRLEAQLDTATAQIASAERIAQVYQRETERLTHQLDQRPAD